MKPQNQNKQKEKNIRKTNQNPSLLGNRKGVFPLFSFSPFSFLWVRSDSECTRCLSSVLFWGMGYPKNMFWDIHVFLCMVLWGIELHLKILGNWGAAFSRISKMYIKFAKLDNWENIFTYPSSQAIIRICWNFSSWGDFVCVVAVGKRTLGTKYIFFSNTLPWSWEGKAPVSPFFAGIKLYIVNIFELHFSFNLQNIGKMVLGIFFVFG